VTPSPDTRHQTIVGALHLLVASFLQRRGIGRIFLAPFDVVLSDLDVVEPDLVYVSAERASIVTAKNVQGAPDLVIEVLSPSTRRTDEVTKRKLYDRVGVREYWIVDPELETIKVHRRSDHGFTRAAELTRDGGDVLATPLLPGLLTRSRPSSRNVGPVSPRRAEMR